MKDEIVAAGRDPAYFIRRYVKIKHPERGLIPFDMYLYQEKLLENYIEHRFNVVLKARQLGISEITASYAAWLMEFHRDQNILVVATKAETAKNIIRKVRTALTKIPRWMQIADVDVDNVLSIELDNGSMIKAVATSSDVGRSEALSLLIIDEAAFIKNFDELWTGLTPTVSAGGRIIVLSTPNGVGNVFYRIYTDAEADRNEYSATKIMWWEHPEHREGLREDSDVPGGMTSDWFAKETKGLSPREIAQEYACNFNASGDTVVGSDIIKWLDDECVIQPQFIEWHDRRLYVWHRPQLEHRYVISVDVSRGDAADSSTFQVIDVGTREQVAEYIAKVKTDELADVACTVGHDYNVALMVVENNSIGVACLDHVIERGYQNLYYSRRNDSRPGEAVDSRFGPMSQDLIPGFSTTPRTRPLMLNKLEELLRSRALVVRSSRLLSEFRTFIWNNGRAEAQRGKSDDLVMAFAIGTWIVDTFLGTGSNDVELQKKILTNMSVSKIVNTDIRGASKDPRLVPASRMGSYYRPRNPYVYDVKPGISIDLRELFDAGIAPVRK